MANEETNTKPKTLQERGIEAAQKYMKSKGYEILDVWYKCKFGTADVVARDENALVFTSVDVLNRDTIVFPPDDASEKGRQSVECVAASYLQSHDYIDMPVRFDAMKLMILGEDKAFVRYHVNAFGIPGDKPKEKEAPAGERLKDRAKSASEVGKTDKAPVKDSPTK